MKGEFLLEDESAPRRGKTNHSSPVRWVVSLALLFLVPALVIAVVLSDYLQLSWLSIDIVLCILTALFCVLVAVSLTLSGCGQQFQKMEQNLHPATEVLNAVRSEQAQLCKAVQSTHQNLVGKISRLEENHRSLQENTAKVVSAIGEEYALLRQMAQNFKQELANSLAATTGNHQELQAAIVRLQKANELMSSRITAIPEGQEELQGTIQAEIRVLADRMAAIPEGQQELRETLQGENRRLADRIAAIPGSQEKLRETLQRENKLLADRIAAIPQGQQALRETLQEENRRLAEMIAAIPEGQQALRETLQEDNRRLAETIAAIPEGQQALRETLQEDNRRLAETIATIPEGQQALRETLQAENRRLAEGIAVIPESQQALREAVQEDNRRLAEMIAAIPEGQQALRETLQAENRLLADRIAGLETSQEQLEGTASTLQVLTQTAASSITNIADEQAALHKTLRENIEAQTSSIQAAEQHRQAMEEQVNRVDEASQQATAVLTTVRTGQNTLLETIEAKNEELAGQLLALSGSQQTIQTSVNGLEDRTDQTMGEVRAIRDGQTSANEVLQAHAEDVGSQMSALVARGEQIDSRLNHLKELSQALADRTAGIASEQASLHRTAQDNSQMLAEKIEGTRQSIQDNIGGLDEKASQIIADINSVAATQSDLYQVVEANDQAAAGKLTALLESQLTFHAGANLVSEKTEHTVAQVVEVAAQQATLGEALQAHMEAFNAEIPPLVAGNGQLKDNVNHLTELAQGVADTVTRIADEQSTLQGILQNNTQVLTDNISFNEQNQKTLQKEVNRVAAAGEQTTTAVAGMASEQTKLRDLLRTNNEELINQCTVLAESQRALIAGVNGLGEKTADAAAKVAGVIAGQSSLTEAVQTHGEEIAARMSALADGQGHVTSNLGSLQEVAQAVSSKVANMTDEQVALETTIREGIHTLDNGMKDVTQRQQALEEEVSKVAQGNQETAAAMACIAAEQTALHQTLETDNREMNDQFASLSEEQHNLRVELSKVAESGQDTAAATSSVATHQATLNDVINAGSEELNRHLSSLSENQQRLKGGIAEIDDKIVQTAARLGSLAEEQATLHELTQDSAKDASDRADALVQTQQNLREGLDRLQQIGQDMADQIAQIADAQSDQAESVQRENGELLDRLNTLTGNQGQLHSNVNGLREISQRVAGQVKDLTDGQVALQKTLQDSTKATTENHAAVAHNQQSLQTELNKVAEASRQAAAVVTAMAAEQDTLREMLRADNEELSGQVTALSQDQQANIERLSETAQQVVTDLMAVDSRQIKLEEAIQAYSEDLLARVAAVKQDQQQWLEQVDATQAKMHPMWERVEALSQEVVRFQEAVQRSVQDLSDLLDARNQQRMEFEDRVNQDLTAITESVSHITEAWGCLQAQVRGKEDSTPTHSEDMAWAIAQLKSQSSQRQPSSNSIESTPGPEVHQPVDASLNIELGGDDKQP